jgi:hypothetical protein
MKNLNNFSEFLNESASFIHLKDMTDLLSKAGEDLHLVEDDNARQIQGVLRKIVDDMAGLQVSNELPSREFMQNLVASLMRLKEQGKAVPFSRYPAFSEMGGKFSAPLGSLQKAIDKAKHILGFTV